MKKTLNNLGLCMRSGNIILGENLVVEAIRANKCCLVFLANDAGVNTTKKIKDKAQFYNVDVDTRYNSMELSMAIGKDNCKVLCISNTGKSFLKILKG